MKEKELTDALEQYALRVGVRPVISLLVEWIGRGLYQDVMADAADQWVVQ